jgi:hypothetical protein
MTFKLIEEKGLYVELQIDDGHTVQCFPLDDIAANLPLRLHIVDKKEKLIRRYKIVLDT